MSTLASGARVSLKTAVSQNKVLCACLKYFRGSVPSNLVPRAHVPFGQHQDTELWNNQFPETKILGLPASQRMRGFVYRASRD